jgi:membrane dipeptidase
VAPLRTLDWRGRLFTMRSPMAARLIDVHCNWLRQYAPEITTFGHTANDVSPERLKQLDGYMTATAAVVLGCGLSPTERECHPDAWRSVGDLVARYEAEFCGRLLIGPAELTRWQLEPPDGLTWGMLGVSGLDHLVRDAADLQQLAGLFKRGARVIQLVETANNGLAGSADPGDERGLTELGRACVSQIAGLALIEGGQGIPILDLAHMNPRSMVEVIELAEEAVRNGWLLLMYSHGALAHAGFDGPRAIDVPSLTRLRALGGLIGLTPGMPFYQSGAEFQAAIEQVATIPFEGRMGYQGIAIGSDFLELDGTLPDLGDASAVVEWVSRTFDQAAAALLFEGNARALLAKAAGGEQPVACA